MSLCPLKVATSVDVENLPVRISVESITINTDVKDGLLHLVFFSEDLGDTETIILTPLLNGVPYVQPIFDDRPPATGYVLSRCKAQRHVMCVALHLHNLKINDQVTFVAQKSDIPIIDASKRHDYNYDADGFEHTKIQVTIATVGRVGVTTVSEVVRATMDWAQTRLQKGQECEFQADMLYAAASMRE